MEKGLPFSLVLEDSFDDEMDTNPAGTKDNEQQVKGNLLFIKIHYAEEALGFWGILKMALSPSHSGVSRGFTHFRVTQS